VIFDPGEFVQGEFMVSQEEDCSIMVRDRQLNPLYAPVFVTLVYNSAHNSSQTQKLAAAKPEHISFQIKPIVLIVFTCYYFLSNKSVIEAVRFENNQFHIHIRKNDQNQQPIPHPITTHHQSGDMLPTFDPFLVRL